MNLDAIVTSCRQKMDRSEEYLEKELRGIRTGRATTALIDYLKISYYGNPTDLRELAAVSVPEPTQLLVKPFDPSVKHEIVKVLESSDLGFNPQVDGQTIRIAVPPPSAERRKQLVGQVKKMAEDAKVALRNERRDAMKLIDQLVKDKDTQVSEDQGHDAKDQVEKLTKKHIEMIEGLIEKKVAEVMEV